MKALKSKLAAKLLSDSTGREQLRKALMHQRGPNSLTSDGALLTVNSDSGQLRVTAKLVSKAANAG